MPSTLLVMLSALWLAPPSCDGAEPPGDRVPGLIRALERLDADSDGRLETSEIPDLARPHIQRWAMLAGLDLSKPFPVKELEKGVRLFLRKRKTPPGFQPKPGRPSTSGADGYVRDFGPEKDEPPIPGFGTDIDPSVVILQADLDRAASRLRSYDRNRDGLLDRREIARGHWSDDPFAYDANRDNRLSRQEMAVRYARRRMREASEQRRTATAREKYRARQKEREAQQRSREQEARRRMEDPRNREAWYVSGSIMYRYDLNRSGMLERDEWQNLGEKAALADADGHGRVDRRELVLWLLKVAERPDQGLPAELPEWFRRRDLNSDAQVTMAEFADQWSEEKVAEFAKFDRNTDGVVTPEECLGVDGLPAGTFRNHKLQIIPARSTVYSEIVVSDEEPIGDLDVQVSITHTYDSHLDAFLIGPYGDRVELFTAVGGSDDHFHNTVFSDEARRPVTAGKPPFRGDYQPEAVQKKQPSLRQFYGKPIDGTWTLVVEARRSDRPGALHGWTLIAKPVGDGEGPTDPPDRSRSDADRPDRDRSEREPSGRERRGFGRPRR